MPDMYQIKGILFKCPIGFRIIYFELYVWWDPLRTIEPKVSFEAYLHRGKRKET